MPRRNRIGITPNEELNQLNSAPAVFNYAVSTDATAAQTAFVAPYPLRIIDIIVKANATNASGTIVPRKGTDAMCTGIPCATDGTVSRLATGAAVANDARLTLARGDAVTVISVGGTTANTRGFVSFICTRL